MHPLFIEYLLNFFLNFSLIGIGLIVIIIMHELSHLIVAKLCKCDVEVFSIGFGKPVLFKKKFKKTIYQITPWILGGYCQLKNEFKYSRSKYAFTNQPYLHKCAIVLAGIATNIVIGLFALILARYYIPDTFKYMQYYMWIFGILSFTLGVTNALPFPALDGSYPLLILLEKKYGKKRGYALMEKICNIGFYFLMFLNVLAGILLFIWLELAIYSAYLLYR